MKVAAFELGGASDSTTSLSYLFSTFKVLTPRPGFLMRLPLLSWRFMAGADAGRNGANLYWCAGSAVDSPWMAVRIISAVDVPTMLVNAEDPAQIARVLVADSVSTMRPFSTSSWTTSVWWAERTASGGK